MSAAVKWKIGPSVKTVSAENIFFSEISHILSENTIVINFPFVYLAIHASERRISP
jgi:hypothetical protein